MPVIEWNDGLSVGVEEIDNDHKTLIALINALFVALDEGDTQHSIEDSFDRLEDYIHRHFSREEALMAQYHYSDRADHQAQHRNFTDRVRELKAELLSSSSREVAEKAIDFLTQWLIHHIVAEDTKLAHLIKTSRQQTQPGWGGVIARFTRTVPFRTRVLLTALIPTLGMVCLSLYVVLQSAAKANALTDLESLYQLADESSHLVHALQAERGLSIGLPASRPKQFTERIRTLRSDSDATVLHFQTYLNRLQQSNLYPLLPQLGELLALRSDELAQIRVAVDNQLLASDEIQAYYTAYIEELLQIADRITHVPMSNAVSNSISAYISLIHYKEKLGLERALGLKAIENGKMEGQTLGQFYQLLGQQQALLQAFFNAASPALSELLEAEQRSDISEKVLRLQQRLLDRIDTNQLAQLSGDDWWGSFTDRMNQLQVLLDQLSLIIVEQMQHDRAEQERIVGFTVLLTGLFLILLWWLSWLLIRSVVEPVEKVTVALSRLASGDQTVLLNDLMADDELRHILTAYERCRVEILQGSYDEARSVLNEQKANRYRTLSSVDPLTGLLNRRRFSEMGRVELERAVRFNTPVTVLIIDVDRFKQVNDRFGHDFGDRVLQGISHALERQARSSDILARIGGEEFAMLLPQTRLEQARPLVERLLNQVRQLEFECDGQLVSTTISVGVVMWDGHSRDGLLSWLLKQADRALYQAKQQGRDRFCEQEPGAETDPVDAEPLTDSST
ncbi:diguanylate cyclase [Motiliproteus coralliicola]|uniref:diguanylate cyclase n=1 Tax=Motiliproteus coralliicola TaxID=2283196 RepID=A0A369WEF8_9GAMM|nr:bacteriohemerythrin [Motiliproteus coralliicola]RDE19539.1 diguanylate cyclase [Motiliproteus coralliicola]